MLKAMFYILYSSQVNKSTSITTVSVNYDIEKL